MCHYLVSVPCSFFLNSHLRECTDFFSVSFLGDHPWDSAKKSPTSTQSYGVSPCRRRARKSFTGKTCIVPRPQHFNTTRSFRAVAGASLPQTTTQFSRLRKSVYGCGGCQSHCIGGNGLWFQCHFAVLFPLKDKKKSD